MSAHEDGVRAVAEAVANVEAPGAWAAIETDPGWLEDALAEARAALVASLRWAAGQFKPGAECYERSTDPFLPHYRPHYPDPGWEWCDGCCAAEASDYATAGAASHLRTLADAIEAS